MTLNELRYKIAVFIAPPLAHEIDRKAREIAPRVILREYDVNFYDASDNPEDELDRDEQTEMKLWAKANTANPYFEKFIRWAIDVQANHAIRYANTEREADFARATINAFELLKQGVDRLTALHDKEQKDKQPVAFDATDSGISES